MSLDLSKNAHVVSNILESIKTIGEKSGVIFNPYTKLSLGLFDQIEPPVQTAVISAMECFKDILESVEPDPFRIKYESDLLKEASLKYCAYDPCLMLLKKWDELFERDPKTDKDLFERAQEVTLKSEGLEPWGLKDHIISEKLSPERNEFKMTMKNIAPCFHAVSGKRVGWASTLRVTPLGSYFRNETNVTPFR